VTPAIDFGWLERLQVKRLQADHRKLEPGDTFIAYPGERHDGRAFIGAAIEAGAHSVLWERQGFDWNPEWKVPNVGIENLSSQSGIIASRVYGNPSRRLWVIGVTGTNGKTSCTHWLAHALTGAGRKSAVVGTLGAGVPGRLAPSAHTTPDAVSLQRTLKRFVGEGFQAVAMEVSSHGLAQGRVNGIEFDVAVFTNLTRDHLDYHGDLSRYKAAKAMLFAAPGLSRAVLNFDDSFGRELRDDCARRGVPVSGYGFDAEEAAIRGRNLLVSLQGIRFDFDSPQGPGKVWSPLVGRFNAANLLACLATLLAADIAPREAAALLAEVQPVPGRMERLGGGELPLVVVDYAHTPDALEKVLSALRELQDSESGRLICVFGCGGDRDRGKRPLMGEVASQLADFAIVTSDNPRSEDPQSIILEIVSGMRGDYRIEADRATAIADAIASARRGDLVLIAGKGHERYQEVAGVKHPFDDVTRAQEALEQIK
jgi:UDP-N-acetylmuramoyl-L-alanyl-D-glutamate--2,6-diaminopimelate ligase